MNNILNKLALILFDISMRKKGYRFLEATSAQQQSDADSISYEDGYSFPPLLMAEVMKYKKGTIEFVAYHNNTPVGKVRLANPKVMNRPFDLYGQDEAGEHYEIQTLIVEKEFRDGTQLVMLGLFKAMYIYSIKHSVKSWNCCGARNMYMTMRRYCRKIQITEVDFAAITHPVTRFLCAQDKLQIYFVMDVASFEPRNIFKKFIKKRVRKSLVYEYINNLLRTISLLRPGQSRPGAKVTCTAR